MEHHVYQNEHDFAHKVEELLKSGVKPAQIDIRAPHPVHHVEEMLATKPSDVRLFALLGGLVANEQLDALAHMLEEPAQTQNFIRYLREEVP